MGEEKRVENIFSELKPVCFGRLLIDVPNRTQVVYGPAVARFKVLQMATDGKSVDNLIKDREATADEKKKYAYPELLGADSILGKVIKGDALGQKIFVGVSPASGGFYYLESFQPVGNDVLLFEAEAFSEKKNYSLTIADLKSVASHVSERKETEIPRAAGICLDRAFIQANHSLRFESFTLGIRFLDRPDIHFSILATLKDRLVESDAIEPRMKKAEQDATRRGTGDWYSRIKFLRRGKAKVGTWSGYEALTRLPSQEKQGEHHHFVFASHGTPNDPYAPVLNIEMRTGVKGNAVGQAQPSIDDNEAIYLWDKLLATLRVRPIAK